MVAALGACDSTVSVADFATVQELAFRLRAPSERDRIDAASRLKAMGREAEDARPALVGALRDEAPMVRVVAAAALGSLGPEAASPLGLALQSDSDPGVRAAAASAIGVLGPRDAPQGLAALARAMDDSSDLVRARAVIAMERFGAPARTYLDRAAKDESALVRDAARTGSDKLKKRLAGHAGADPAALAALTRTLIEGSAYDRAIAAQNIGQMGRAAAPALPNLAAALQDKNSTVRVAAAGALRSCGVQALGALLEALKDGDSSVRTVAAEGIGRLGREARSAVGALAGRLEDPELAVRVTAVESLARIGGQEASLALQRATKDRDWFVRDRAIRALTRMDPARAAAD